MAGNDSQKQFLTLIRDFASEKSQGERRVINLKKRSQELQSELEVANTEVEEAKHQKETADQELKGYEVELARNESAIQTLEERIVLIQDELSAYGSDVEALKNKESETRDDFIEKMLDLNAQIRKFHETRASIFQNDNCSDSASNPAGPAKAKGEDAEAVKRDLQNKLAQIVSQITKEEEEYQVEQNIHSQLEEELNILERKASLIEGITKENMEMQELARQTSELENRCASLGDELQRRSVCPSCHRDNTEALGEIVQAGNEN
ncbi:uncharacterized protein LOC107788503 isoform X1 [Nicotiana tabacum]|uniref:Autophagy-related protein 11-like isoform X1 n=1 Tax=Nicotiana tabacum TaxID=4097 RepID=A0A1S3ZN27_TOBAC|nr:PREDICTED: autophagy-related protein 11-like isoform X1 [Nicotiana tabacum]